MPKLVINDITSGYASVDTLNSNFTAIETALENTLSRDGTTPNSMTADLDMNGHRLLNLVATQGEANFTWLGTWLPNTQYYQNNLVYAAEGTELGNGLICTKDHLSGATLNADMADPTKWDVYVQRGASVGGIAGPVSSTVNYIPQWSDTTGTTLKGGIPIGSGGVQAYDTELAALATLTSAANKIPYFTGSGTANLLTIGTSSGDVPLVGTSSATETLAGLIEVATNAETIGLVDTSRAVVPANLTNGVKAAIGATGTAPIYACRAWVNFDGTGAIGTNQTIRASGNVTSVYKNATGDYTINFTTALPDANYVISQANMVPSQASYICEQPSIPTRTSTALRILSVYGGGVVADGTNCSVVIFR